MLIVRICLFASKGSLYNYHRYGYAEELEYMKDLGKVPYRTGDQTFDRIADYLYAEALTYDRLIKKFYPHYQNRSDAFLPYGIAMKLCEILYDEMM